MKRTNGAGRGVIATYKHQAGPGIVEALRRQEERARRTTVGEDMEERIMSRLGDTPRRTTRALWHRVAAVVAAVTVMAGLAFAAVMYVGHNHGRSEAESCDTVAPCKTIPGQQVSEGGALVNFEGVRMDSMLMVVAGHYGRVVQFRSEEARAMRLIMTWNPADSLVDFVSRLNRFEGLTLTLREDTLVVEAVTNE